MSFWVVPASYTTCPIHGLVLPTQPSQLFSHGRSYYCYKCAGHAKEVLHERSQVAQRDSRVGPEQPAVSKTTSEEARHHECEQSAQRQITLTDEEIAYPGYTTKGSALDNAGIYTWDPVAFEYKKNLVATSLLEPEIYLRHHWRHDRFNRQYVCVARSDTDNSLGPEDCTGCGVIISFDLLHNFLVYQQSSQAINESLNQFVWLRQLYNRPLPVLEELANGR